MGRYSFSSSPSVALLLAALAAGAAPAPRAQAATLTYDADMVTGGVQDGSGAWDLATANWWDGSADVVWTNSTADTAAFGNGGTAGTVTASGTISVGALTFNAGTTGNYTVTGGTLSGVGTITSNAAGTTTINSNIGTGTGTLLTKGNALTLGGQLNLTTLNVGNIGTGLTTVTLTGANTIGTINVSSFFPNSYSATNVPILVLGNTGGGFAVSGNIGLGNGNYSSSGMLRLAANDQIAHTSLISMNMSGSGHYGAHAYFELLGYSATVAGIDSAGGASDKIYNGASANSTLTFEGTSGSHTFNGSVLDNGTGTLSIVKNGAGTQIFNGAGATISYSGSTTVNTGTLSIRNSTLTNSAATVSGGTLDLQGATLNRAITGSSGQITITGGATTTFGGGNKTYSVDTVISGNSTLQQGAANSLSANSIVSIGSGSTLNTGNLAGSVKGLSGAGTVNLAGASANLTLSDGASQRFSGSLTGLGRLTKAGSGTQFLTGSNSHTGGTVVTGGLLVGTSSSALGTNGNLTIANGAAFAYEAASAGALNMGSGVLNLAGGSRLGTTVGGSAITSSAVAVTGGAVTVDIYGIPSQTLATGTHTLVSTGGGLTGATYAIGNVYNAINFTVGNLQATSTAITVDAVAATALTDVYWKGSLSGAPAQWAASNGVNASNWASDAAGTATPLTPGSSAILHFSAAGATNQGAMTLGANMGVRGIVVSDTAALALNDDGYGLTLGSVGLTVNAGAGAVTLGSALTMGSAQTWTNAGGNALTVANTVANGGFLLSVVGSGAGTTTLSGAVSGAGGLAKSGTGTLVLSGANTYAGATTISGGTLKVNSASALGTTTTAVTLGGTAGAALDITGFNTTVGSFGGGSASAGNIVLGAATLTTGGNNASTFHAGAISGTGGLVKTGTGTLTLDGSSSNTYSGTTTVYQGALSLRKTGGATAMGGNLTFDNNLSPDVYCTVDNQFAAGAVVSFVTDAGDHGRWELMGTTQTVAGIQTVGYTNTRGVIQNQEMGPANTGNSTLVLNGSGDYTFTGYLRNSSGTLALTKNGTGTQTLAGNQISYTGGTTLNAGNLTFAAANTTIGGGVVLNGGTLNQTGTGWFVINGALNVAVASVINISNTGNQNQMFFDGGSTGSGQLTFNNTGAATTGVYFRNGSPNSRTGATIVNGGFIGFATATGNLSLANSDLTLNGAKLELADGQFDAAIDNTGGVTVKSLSGTGTVSGSNRAATLTIGSNNGTGSFSGIISDGGGATTLVKTGSGTQTLSGANTYSGTTTVNGGTLVISGANATTGATTVNGATLNLDYTSQDNSKLADAAVLTLAGATVNLVGGTHAEVIASTTLNAGATAIARSGGSAILQMGAITRNAGATANFSADGIATTTTTTTNGLLGSWATVGSGAATRYATVDGSNNIVGYAGGTAAAGVNDFTVATTNYDYALSGGTDTLTASRTAHTVRYTGSGETVDLGAAAFTLTANAILNAGTGTLTVARSGGTGSMTAGATGELVLTAASGDIAVSAPISGTGLLVVNGSGTVTLSGANTYSGGTSVQGGTLRLSGSGTLGNANSQLSITGGTLDLNGIAQGVGNFTGSGGTLTNTGSAVTFTMGNNNAGGGNFAGSVTGNIALTKIGTGTLTLSGNASNTYTGLTTLGGAGQLILSKTGGAVAIGGNINMSANGSRSILSATESNQFAAGSVMRFTVGSVDTRFELNGTTQTLGGIDSTGFAGSYAAIQHREFSATAAAASGVSTLVLDVADSASYSFGNMTATAVIRDYNGGSMRLIKNGNGTQTLVGTGITYTGVTTVNGGILRLQDTTNFNSAVVVGADGTLVSARTTAGFASRDNILGNNITGSGTLNIDNAAGLGGGWTTVSVTNGLTMAGGTINVNSGVFARDNTSANNINTTATVDVDSGAFFGAGRGGNSTIGALNGAGVVSTLWIGTNAGSITIGNGGGSGSFSGTISGNGTNATDGTQEGGILSLIKVGSGTQTLSGNNTYAGTTTVNEGILEITANNALGAITQGTTVASGGTLKLTNVEYMTTEALSINGTGAGGTGALLNSGTSTYAGAVTVASNATIHNGGGTLTLTGGVVKNGTTVTFAGSGRTVISGTGISGAAANSDMVVDGGVLVVNAASDYNGPTTVQNGGTLAGIGPLTSTLVTVNNGSFITAGINEFSGTIGTFNFTTTTAADLDGTYLVDLDTLGISGNQADGTKGDLLAFDGDVDLTNLKIRLRGTNTGGASTGYAVKLLSWTGTATGAVADGANFTNYDGGLGLAPNQSIVRWGNAYYLVPEPASFALLGLGCLLLLRRPSRRRGRAATQV